MKQHAWVVRVVDTKKFIGLRGGMYVFTKTLERAIKFPTRAEARRNKLENEAICKVIGKRVIKVEA
jgi:hypothetical protein